MPIPGYLPGHRVHTHGVLDTGHTHTENLAESYTKDATTASATTGIVVKAVQG
jgi:hypothetical protein